MRWASGGSKDAHRASHVIMGVLLTSGDFMQPMYLRTPRSESMWSGTPPQCKSPASDLYSRHHIKWPRTNLRPEYAGVSLLFLGTMLFMPVGSSKTIKSNIHWAQFNLYRAGLYSGPWDGIMDSNTRATLRKYQESKGLPVTGKPDKATLEVMSKDTSIQQSQLPLPEGYKVFPNGTILLPKKKELMNKN